MNPINNQNPIIEPEDAELNQQIDQQALESAKNIIQPEATVIEPLKPFNSGLNAGVAPQLPQQPAQVVVQVDPDNNSVAQVGAIVPPAQNDNTTTYTQQNFPNPSIAQPTTQIPGQPQLPPLPEQPQPTGTFGAIPQQQFTMQPSQPQTPQNTYTFSQQQQPAQVFQPQTSQVIQPNQTFQSVQNQPTFNGPQPIPQYSQQPTILMGSVDAPATSGQFNPNFNPPKPPSNKKFIIGGLVGAILVVGGIAAFLFLIYLPNQPQNVWNTGISRTGKQLSAIITKVNEPSSKATIEKNKFTLKGKLEVSDASYSVNVDTKFDKTNSNSAAKVQATNSNTKETMNIDAEINTKAIENAMYPNIYFKLSGFSKLGLDGLIPGVNNYDGKWIAVEQDFLKKFESKTTTTSDNSKNNLTEAEILSIMNDANSVTQQYVFTTDQTKAIMAKTSYKATEQSEGITANHYTAKLNDNNVKAYCTALVDKMSTNAAVKKLSTQNDADFAKTIQDAKDECTKAKPYDKEFDIWIDKKYKVFHKIRLNVDVEKNNAQYRTEKGNCLKEMGSDGQSMCAYYDDKIETGDKYIDIGQVFKSRDQFVMFISGVSNTDKDKSKVRAEFTVNAKTLAIGGSIKANSEDAKNKFNLDLTVSTEPYTGDIATEKPAGAIPLQQVLDALKIGQN